MSDTDWGGRDEERTQVWGVGKKLCLKPFVKRRPTLPDTRCTWYQYRCRESDTARVEKWDSGLRAE